MIRRTRRYVASPRQQRSRLAGRLGLRRLATTERKSTDSIAGTTARPADDRAGETNDEPMPDADAAAELDDTQLESEDQTALADDDKPNGPRHRDSTRRIALLFGIAAFIAVVALGAWLGYRTNQTRESQQGHDLFLQAGRQAAVNLTSINYNEVDADLQRITDSSTGAFHDDFRQRAPSFAEFVKQIKSVSQATVSDAAVESVHGDDAQVIVAVKVDTSTAADGSQQPRYWRMRIGVQKVDGTAKVTNVEFVS